MKRLFSLLFAAMLAGQAWAQTITIDGLYYNCISTSYTRVYMAEDTLSGDIVIPAEIIIDGITYKVTDIGYRGFKNCTGLTSVIISDGIKNISYEAFEGCSNLTSVSIPNSVTTIEGDAFQNCISLKEVALPDNLTVIPKQLFYHCDSLTSVSIPDGIKTIQYSAFYGCGKLTSLSIPNSVTNIGESAFEGCSQLKTVNIPDSVTSISDRLFCGCDSLASIEIPNCVTSIGELAFYSCGSLPSIIIPDSVTEIGKWAFCNCKKLTTANIPDGVTTIPDLLFDDCRSLTSITIPNGITSIGEYAFHNCIKLDSIYIPNTVTSIGRDAFCGCKSLTSITIPNTITTIGEFTFGNCDGLTNITIPNSVTSIGESAFYHCDSLASITIGEGVTSISDGAFDQCYSLKKANFASIESLCKINFSSTDANPLSCAKHLYIKNEEVTELNIPNSVTSISNIAFKNCKGLVSVTIGDSVKSIGNGAFAGCSNLTSVVIGDSVKTIGKSAFEDCVKLSSLTIGNGVTSIGDLAFRNCESLTKVDIPNSVKNIGKYAFRYCDKLTTLTISNSVNTIGDEAFKRCTRLESVTIGDSVKIIGKSAFEDCFDLLTVNIPNSVDSIGENAFKNCNNLKYVAIPDRVSSIGLNAFDGVEYIIYSGNAPYKPWGAKCCYSAMDENGFIFSDTAKTQLVKYVGTDSIITIPQSVINIGKEAFIYNYGLTSVTIPNSVSTIGESAFSGCIHLTTITLSDSLEQIAAWAFKSCSGLKKITIPNSVSYIGNGAFLNCRNLASVNIPDSLTSINSYVFQDCDSLSSITIPNTITSIGSAAFSGCDGLISIDIPNSVTSIGESAFRDCSHLASVKLPNSIKRIAQSMFNSCYNLESVTIPNTVTEIDNSAFESCGSLTYINIPNYVSRIGSDAFNNCWRLTSVTIPQSVNNIGNDVFRFCYPATIYCQADTLPLEWLWIDWNSSNIPVKWHCKVINISFDEEVGNVTANKQGGIGIDGSIWYSSGTEIMLTATSKNGKHARWEDGSYDNPRTITIITDSTYSATFEEHTAVVDSAVAPTCTLTGLTEGSHCSVCDSVIVKQKVVPANGHIAVIDSAVAPTWTETGLTEGSHCSVCGTVLVAQEVIPQLDESPDFTYSIINDSTVSVTGYIGTRTSITIPDTVEIDGKTYTVTCIGESAFRNCEKITSITIPNTITDINYGAFSYCRNLTAINIPNSVKHIDGAAFISCKSLTEIVIPDGITEIESQTFDGCTSLASVTIPESVTKIGGIAFEDCSSLTSITIPQNVTSISSSAFRGCYNLTEMNLNGNNYYSFENQTLFNKDKTELLCCLNSKVTEYTIPNTVKKIGDYAFTDCDLESITIPNSVTTIGYDAFYRCWYLTSVTLPDSLTEIGDYAFAHCGNLKTVIMPESVVKIEESAFYRCDSLVYNEYENTLYLGTNDNPYFALIKTKSTDIASCKINNQCKIIAKDAFYDCDNLQYNEYDNALYLGSSDNQYYMLVKAKSTDIKSCEINSGCRLIWNSAFSDCSKLTSVIVPDGVVQIGDYAFFYCDSLTSINIPGGVTKIGESAFYNCESLTSITIPDGITSIGEYTFNNCENLTSVTIPESVSEIGYSAFFGCSKLTSINIPSGVTSIGNWAIGRCSSLTTINIPKTVTTIGEGAFSSCYNLNIFCEAESKPDGWNDKWNRDNRPVVWGFDVNKKIFKVTVSTEYDWRGTVAGGRWAVDSSTVTIAATPAEDYKFVKWSNGLTTATANITVTSDTVLVAEFEYVMPVLYSVNISANNSEFGRVSGGGYVKNGAAITITATPAEGCEFVKWSNGLTNDTVTITVTSDTTIVAEFAEIAYAGTCGSDATWRYSMLTQTLTISGTGVIERYKTVGDMFSGFTTNTPWSEISNNIKHVVVNEGITNMGRCAFWGCENLETVKLPSTCTSYGGQTFSQCPKLKEVVVAATSIWQVDEYCFSNYDSCTLYVPAGKVDYYKNDVVFGLFSNIVGAYMVIVDADIKNGTVEVDNYAIEEGGSFTITPKPDAGCSLEEVLVNGEAIEKSNSVYMVKNVRSNMLVSAVFSRHINVGGFVFKTVDSTNVELIAYNGTDREITIPGTITDNGVDYTVSKIGNGVFKYVNVISLTVPNSVTTIENEAFSFVGNVIYRGNAGGSPWGALTVNGIVDGNCVFADSEKTHLTAYICRGEAEMIDIPESVVTIGTWAFINGSFNYTIYNNAGYWGNDENPYLVLSSFDDGNRTSCKIHSDCKYILYFAFSNSNLESVTIPNSVISIGEGAFWGSDLASLTIPDGVEVIGNDAFGYCQELSSASISGSVKNIGDRAFCDCHSLSSATISEGVESIGESAFFDCEDLLSLTIPKSVVEIGIDAFHNCYRLTIYSDEYEWPYGWLFDESDVSEVIFKERTAVAETAANAVNIYAHGNTIVVENAMDEISVYDAMGRLVCRDAARHVSTVAESGIRSELQVSGAGVYIVKVGAEVKRVVVND
ncbi:MAG: leucine-rich repeat protein [Salinivirgaceae bacterium]|nr:leucine-rich repeat protein [Salinivirgaceae bacterium]